MVPLTDGNNSVKADTNYQGNNPTQAVIYYEPQKTLIALHYTKMHVYKIASLTSTGVSIVGTVSPPVVYRAFNRGYYADSSGGVLYMVWQTMTSTYNQTAPFWVRILLLLWIGILFRLVKVRFRQLSCWTCGRALTLYFAKEVTARVSDI